MISAVGAASGADGPLETDPTASGDRALAISAAGAASRGSPVIVGADFVEQASVSMAIEAISAPILRIPRAMGREYRTLDAAPGRAHDERAHVEADRSSRPPLGHDGRRRGHRQGP